MTMRGSPRGPVRVDADPPLPPVLGEGPVLLLHVGMWAIEGERLCRTWTTWDHGIRRCYVIVRDGDAYVFDLPERFGRFPARRTADGFAP
jgi:hypothetical protein